MKSRIRLAAEKGFDGVDADNVDAFSDERTPGGGFTPRLNASDTVAFIKALATEAHNHGLAMGLKNAEGLIPSIQDHVQFAVNEECATYSGRCQTYTRLIQRGKPVFHIEYAKPKMNGTNLELKSENGKLAKLNTTQLHSLYCLENNRSTRRYPNDVGKSLSTVIKKMDLDTWVMYCDGSSFGPTKPS